MLAVPQEASQELQAVPQEHGVLGSPPGKYWQFPRNSWGVGQVHMSCGQLPMNCGQFPRQSPRDCRQFPRNMGCWAVPQENAGSSPGTLVVWGSSSGKCWQFPRNSYGMGKFPRKILAQCLFK